MPKIDRGYLVIDTSGSETLISVCEGVDASSGAAQPQSAFAWYWGNAKLDEQSAGADALASASNGQYSTKMLSITVAADGSLVTIGAAPSSTGASGGQ